MVYGVFGAGRRVVGEKVAPIFTPETRWKSRLTLDDILHARRVGKDLEVVLWPPPRFHAGINSPEARSAC